MEAGCALTESNELIKFVTILLKTPYRNRVLSY